MTNVDLQLNLALFASVLNRAAPSCKPRKLHQLSLAGCVVRKNGGHAVGIAQKTEVRQILICLNASHASVQEDWRNVADSMTHQGLEINPPCTNRLCPPLQNCHRFF